jgi:hypothetical protein
VEAYPLLHIFFTFAAPSVLERLRAASRSSGFMAGFRFRFRWMWKTGPDGEKSPRRVEKIAVMVYTVLPCYPITNCPFFSPLKEFLVIINNELIVLLSSL